MVFSRCGSRTDCGSPRTRSAGALNSHRGGAGDGAGNFPCTRALRGWFTSELHEEKQGSNIERQTNVFAAANALEWVEAHRRHFATAWRFRDDEILRIGVGMVPTVGIASESERYATRKGSV